MSDEDLHVHKRNSHERAHGNPEFRFGVDRPDGEKHLYRDAKTARHIEALGEHNRLHPLAGKEPTRLAQPAERERLGDRTPGRSEGRER